MSSDITKTQSRIEGHTTEYRFEAGYPNIPLLVGIESEEKISEFGERIANLETTVSKLQQSITNIDEKMNDMLNSLKEIISMPPRNINIPNVIIVEELDKSTAKQRVFEFIKEHKTSDIEELHENVRCDIRLLIEIIDELCAEGAIIGEE